MRLPNMSCDIFDPCRSSGFLVWLNEEISGASLTRAIRHRDYYTVQFKMG